MDKQEKKIAVTIDSYASIVAGKKLAAGLNLPLVDVETEEFDFLLVVTQARLELREIKRKNSKPIYVDFLHGAVAHRHKYGGGKKQLIARAAGVKQGVSPYILDATAGLGGDAFVLASIGCKVDLVERSPIIAALLRDGIERAKDHLTFIKEGIKLIVADAMSHMKALSSEDRPDVVYLDPMYPERAKSALGKKEMRVLHSIVGDDLDAELLLDAALKTALKRVVVKRPRFAAPISLIKPSLQFVGKSSRFDTYLI